MRYKLAGHAKRVNCAFRANSPEEKEPSHEVLLYWNVRGDKKSHPSCHARNFFGGERGRSWGSGKSRGGMGRRGDCVSISTRSQPKVSQWSTRKETVPPAGRAYIQTTLYVHTAGVGGGTIFVVHIIGTLRSNKMLKLREIKSAVCPKKRNTQMMMAGWCFFGLPPSQIRFAPGTWVWSRSSGACSGE